MTRHIIQKGTFETAQLALSKKGGQLFPARDDDGPFIHVVGSVVTTYWPEHSKRRGYVMELAKQLGFDPNIATTSRLIRFLLDDVMTVPYENTFFDIKWRGLALKGNHWHYLHCIPGKYEYCIEIDLVSAYWTAFTSQPSMLLGQHKTWIDDGGALESFKVLMLGLPKPFRLAFLGSLASWRHSFWTKDKKDPTGASLVLKQRTEIKYGAAFNATHRAILKVWKMMEAIHRLTGSDCVRIHTDGIILDCTNGMKWEAELEDFILGQGFDYSVKASGDTWLMDVNSGIIGRKIMGAHCMVADAARASGIKINLNAPAPEMSRFSPLELPTPEGTEVGVNPTRVDAQTSLNFGVDFCGKVIATH